MRVVGGTVDRVEGDDHLALAEVQTGLLTEHADARRQKRRYRDVVGHHVERVLSDAHTRGPRVGLHGEHLGDRLDHLFEALEERVGIHRCEPTLP